MTAFTVYGETSATTMVYRKRGETPRQLELSRAKARFPNGEGWATLRLDGRVDEFLFKGCLITDLRQLTGRVLDLREACYQSRDQIDLKTGASWQIWAMKHEGESYAYVLSCGDGPQTLTVRLAADSLDIEVATQNNERGLRHAMRGVFGFAGGCDPWSESMTWELTP